MLDQIASEVKQRTLRRIADHRKAFAEKPEQERADLATEAEAEGSQLTVQRHHRVTCPACQCIATVQGTPFGKEHVTHEHDRIVVRQPVSPRIFSCSACGLTLEGYAELDAADLGGQYTRTTTYSPEEYYGLINPDDIGSYVEEYLANMGEEYDNE